SATRRPARRPRSPGGSSRLAQVHARPGGSRFGGSLRRAAAALAVAAAALVPASGALAHGDPTAHYLETDPLLTSYSKPPFVNVELRLRGLIETAAKRGYPIRVVLMADLGDTGDEPFPLEDTQAYVHTISGELEGIKRLKAPVLIVTPHAFGL